MVPLGLFPVLVAAVKIMLIDLKVGESLGIATNPNTRHFPGVVVDKRSFNHSVGRGRRSPACRTGEYLHPNETHCCVKCHPGTYVAQHCLGPGQTTNCSDCPKGQYLAHENSADKCRSCQSCRSATFEQIEKSKCTSTQDTICGCRDDQYRTREDSEFFCKNCTACHNGTIRHPCTKTSDTICLCYLGFFLQADKNICSPCSSCLDGECKAHCKTEDSVIQPQNSSDLKPLLGSLVVLFGVGFVLLLARKFLRSSYWKQQKPTFCSYPSASVQQSGESVPKTTAEEDKTSDSLLKPNQKVVLLPQGAISVSIPSQELPDCVKSAGESKIPDWHEILYTIVDHVPVSRWKEFVRRLGLTENTIERTEMEHKHIRDGQYEMLRQWRLQAGRGATVERISCILNQMELSGCSEAIQEVLPKLP
ncbi:tumor necrosis factor receptor superfamily member 1A-like [Tiliqua scincoides]|uniref:tumor necrosis factor receptor superfamily member 1A-like n=1 Tax=Tiliqua scincoides TaxID=71010 RepID=UPI0034622543